MISMKPGGRKKTNEAVLGIITWSQWNENKCYFMRPVDGALIEQERRAARNAVLGNVVLFMTAIALIKFELKPGVLPAKQGHRIKPK
uniref:Uncharacterized protein n=1 Tax=Rhodnius prolixus TaxID=13249 RepID=T1IBC5_RHOPR